MKEAHDLLYFIPRTITLFFLAIPFHRVLIRVFLGGVLFCSLLNGHAQPLDPLMETFEPEDYGAHSQIFCVEKDPSGGYWFGTKRKVLYLSGSGWEEVHFENNMGIFSMEVDEKGRIWCGGNGDFGYLKPIAPEEKEEGDSAVREEAVGSMRFVSLLEQVPDTLRDFNIVWNIHAFGDKLYINAYEYLFVLDSSGIRPIFPRGPQFYRIHELDGELWIQDVYKGIYRIDGDLEITDDGTLPASRMIHGSERVFERDLQVRSMIDHVPGITGKDQILLVSTEGLFRFKEGVKEGEGKKIITTLGEEWQPILDRAEPYKAIKTYREGEDPSSINPWGAPLLLSTETRGAVLIDTLGRPVRFFDQKKGLAADFVWSSVLGAPGSGNVWSVTNNGITRWSMNSPFSYAWGDGRAFTGKVNDALRIGDELLIATSQGVYVRREGQKLGQAFDWEHIEHTTGQCHEFLPLGRVNGKKEFLVLIGQTGSFRLRRKGGAWEAIPFWGNHAFTSTKVSSEMADPLVLIGGRKGVHFFLKEGEGEEWDVPLLLEGFPQAVSTLRAELFSSNRDSGKTLRIWVGMETKGELRIELPIERVLKGVIQEKDSKMDTLQWSSILKGKAPKVLGEHYEEGAIPGGGVAFLGLKGSTRFCTDSGLYKPRVSPGGKNDPFPNSNEIGRDSELFVPDPILGCKFAHCPEDTSATSVYRVFNERDGQGDQLVWVISWRGVYRLRPPFGRDIPIDSAPFKALQVGGINRVRTDSTGISWMSGTKGLLRFDPEIQKDPERDYPCSIRKITVHLPLSKRDKDEKEDSLLFGGFYDRPTKGGLLSWKRSAEQRKAFEPTLPYSMNELHFHFASPFFERTEKLRYRYFLEGFDEDWSQWKDATKKAYTNLPEGSYTFKVQARNVYGKKSRIATYRFHINPPWYRTWTAYSGYGIAGIGLLWLLLRLNTRRLELQKRKLEKTVIDRTRKIQEQQRETERQKERVEAAHTEITHSIDYARKIQFALLRSEDEGTAYMPDHFILFKPQSQVSGDFYWFKEHRGYLYIAAMDCTGHGVPGAFMSMMGISQLNELLSTDEVPTPGAVLTELRERIVRELSGSEPDETAKDGMDASMVRLPIRQPKPQSSSDQDSDPQGEVEVQFAGAQNSMYIVRRGIGQAPPKGAYIEKDRGAPGEERIKPFNMSPDGLQVKGDRMPVGYDEHAEGDFSTISIPLQKDDMLYLFSDGYADQFGGEKGKKFRYGPFKELLVELLDKPLEEQKKVLDRTFEEWKGDREQIDDVLVMGIRV